MDNLSKLGFLASEMLLKSAADRIDGREDVAVICFNRSSSLETDTQYQATVQDGDNYFPSPSLFVYTLPNIAAGEIAIRNKLHGETSFYICERFDTKQICRTVRNLFSDKTVALALVAWVESFGNTHEVCMFLADRNGDEKMILNENKLIDIYITI
jgi:3-oxoacyl-[acyl-carrier-protein] synthase-1